MIKATPLREQPKDNEYLWKYMNAQKFLSFLMNKQFHYSRLDQLEDAYEGISQKYLTALLFHSSNEKSGFIDVNHKYYESTMGIPLSKMESEFDKRQKLLFVSCWITGNRESAAMWDLYSEPGGVAIKVEFKHFSSMLHGDNYVFDYNSLITNFEYGSVVYKDFADPFSVKSYDFKVEKTAFRKDSSFQHEREFRVCIGCKKSSPIDAKGIKQTLTRMGVLPIDIVLHPKSSPWQTDNVRQLIQNFAPHVPVKKSELKWR